MIECEYRAKIYLPAGIRLVPATVSTNAQQIQVRSDKSVEDARNQLRAFAESILRELAEHD